MVEVLIEEMFGSAPEASAVSLPPLLLWLLPGGANQFPGGLFPLWTTAFHGAPGSVNQALVAWKRHPLVLPEFQDRKSNELEILRTDATPVRATNARE